MTIHDNVNFFINCASAITVIGGAIILLMLISRRYLDAIFEYVDGLPTIDNFMKNYRKLQQSKKGRFFFIIKRIFDIGYSFSTLLLILPIILIVSILIKISSPGPIFFKQKRIGKDGEVFNAYKFRTMVAFSQEDKLLKEIGFINIDPRLTNVGRFLRKLNLDEVPKIFNVLKGDMSIVGTSTAIDFSNVENLSKEIADIILSTKPGIVSLWSLSGSRMRWDLSSRLNYDLYYVYHESFILDLSILLMIVPSLLGRASYENPKIKAGF